MPVSKHAMASDDSHKDVEADAKGTVTSSNKGCIIKCGLKSHGRYRENGYEWVKVDSGRNDFLLGSYAGGYLGAAAGFPDEWQEKGYKGKTLVIKNPDKSPGAFAFSGENYLGGNFPFKNNAHHIMPWSALKGALNKEKGILLQKSGYNLNGGDNIMFLPCLVDTALYIGCYTHPGRHKPYDDECEDAVTELVDKIKPPDPANPEEHDIDDSNNPSLKDSLVAWQKSEYELLKEVGRKTAGENIKGHVPSRIKLVSRRSAV